MRSLIFLIIYSISSSAPPAFALTKDRHFLWTSQNNRAFRFNTIEQQWEGYSLNGSINDIDIDRSGTTWFATKQGIACHQEGQWVYYRPSNTQQGPFIDDYFQCLALDGKGNLWAGTNGGGLACYSGTEWTLFDTTQGLLDMRVTALQVDPHGHLWVGTASGLNRYDGRHWSSYTAQNGLIGNYVKSLVLDGKGTLWVECYNYTGLTLEDIKGGMCAYNGVAWREYAFPSPITRITVDWTGWLWLVTHNQKRGVSLIYSFDGSQWAVVDSSHLKVNDIQSDFTDKLWVGTSKGLFCFDSKTWSQVPETKGKNITRLYVDAFNHTWCSYPDQAGSMVIGEYDGTAWNLRRLTPEKQVVKVIAGEGDLWFAASGGLICYRNEKLRIYDEIHPSVSTFVKDILYDKDTRRLWVATEKGIAYQVDDVWEPFYNQGLKRKQVYSLACDRYDTVWVNSYQWYFYTPGQWTPLNERYWYSLAGNPLEKVVIDSQNRKWFYSLDFPSVKGNAGQVLLSYPHVKDVIDRHQSELLATGEANRLWLAAGGNLWVTNHAEGCLSRRTAEGQWINHPYHPLALTAGPGGTVSLCERYKVIQYRNNAFTPLPLPEHLRFRDVWADPGDQLWIEGENELIRYAQGMVSVLPFPPPNSTRAASYQWYPVHDFLWVSSLAYPADRQLWIASNTGLYSLTGSRVMPAQYKHPLPTDQIKKIVVDTQDQLWAIHNFGASRLAKEKWQHYTIRDGLISNLLSDVMVARDSSLWFCAPYGVSHYTQGEWKNYTSFGSVSYPNIQCVAQDSSGCLWLGTLKGLLCYIDQAWSHLDRRQGISSDSVYAIGVDRDNTIWLGTAAGIASFRDRQILREYPLLPCDPGSQFLVDGQGTLWLLQVSPQGAHRFLKYTGDTWTEYFNDLNKLSATFTPDNKLYIGSLGGLFMIQDY